MFYPKLTRRTAYKTKQNGDWYSSCEEYRAEILEDSQHRCVYCDIRTTECSDDLLQLDHFKPRSLFPELSSNPTNLVAACPVCNWYKSNHWPVGKDSEESYSGQLGFIDPFKENSAEFFCINAEGEIGPQKPPAKYIIRILRLNRAARVRTRKSRMLRKKYKDLADGVNQSLGELHREACDVSIPRPEFAAKFEKFRLACSKLLEFGSTVI